MKIISANERLAEPKGVKALIVGPSGVGKTSLLRTVPLPTTLFIDLEAGDLAVQNLPLNTVRPETWEQCRDLAALLGGPNPSLPPTACYSEAHYRAVCERLGNLAQLTNYHLIFVDSLTYAGRLYFRWAEQQPEAFSDRSGKKDLRGAYGLHARELIGWLMQLQRIRATSVVFVGILEKIVDEFGRSEWAIQLEGSKTSRELPGIVDQIITMQFVDFGDGKLTRAFVCTSPNQWLYPAKDRSGRLNEIEEPHLGKLIEETHQQTQARRFTRGGSRNHRSKCCRIGEDMTLDFNDAPEQREFDLISTGTVVTLRITLRPGGAGDGGWLKRSADGGCEMLDIEYVLLDGPFAKRKFWENLVVGGTTDGHAKAADISRGRLRAMLESARGVLPDDKSDEARQKRRAEYADLDGLSFIGKIGVKKGERRGNGENYPDKNILDAGDHAGQEGVAHSRASAAGSKPARRLYASSDRCSIQEAGVGIMSKLKLSQPSISAIEDIWQRRATDAAIKAARDIIKFDGGIPPGTPISRLGDTEWGWLVAAILFGWIGTRAEQAAAEGFDTELAIRVTGFAQGEPWDAGAIATILPDLFTMLEEWQGAAKVDWKLPIQDWSREQMVDFLLQALCLIRNAMTARDVGGGTVTRKRNDKLDDRGAIRFVSAFPCSTSTGPTSQRRRSASQSTN